MKNVLASFSQKKTAREKIATTLLRSEVLRGRTPSVNYYFFDHKNILYSCRYGLADISNSISLTDDTTYNAFSVTKTFTAIAILQLQEKGIIDIDDEVKKYFPQLPYRSKITIKQILNHSSGIPNPIPLSWIHLAQEHANFNSRIFFNNVFAKNKTVKFQPNEKFYYSNLGFVILGQLIEEVSGQSYEGYTEKNFFKPLQLADDDLGFVIANASKHAKGYHKKYSLSNLVLSLLIDKNKFFDKNESGWNSFKPLYVNGASYGGLIGKPKAFVRYLQDLLRDNSLLLNDASRQLLLTENDTSSGKKTGMSLSWFKGKLGNQEYFAHAGGGGGYYSEIRFYPQIKKGSVIFFNRSGMRDERFLDNVDKYFVYAE
jgi:CubicO group peptidase (beta-lactamase class C family)